MWWASLPRRLFSSCSKQGLVSLRRRLLLQSSGSRVVYMDFSCSKARRIFPTQGWKPCLLHWQANSLPMDHQGRLRHCFLLGLPIKHPTGLLGARCGVGSAQVHQQTRVPLVCADTELLLRVAEKLVEEGELAWGGSCWGHSSPWSSRAWAVGRWRGSKASEGGPLHLKEAS